MRTLDNLRRELMEKHAELGNWRLVGEHFGVSKPMAYRVAVQGHEPKRADIRLKLGLPALVEVVPCPECGEVHGSRRCRRPRPPKDLYAIKPEALLWMLENRSEDF